MSASLQERMQRVIRQDIQSMHGYAVQPSAGMVKLDSMENPFGLPQPLRVYADVSLRRFDVVVPAAGDTHHALRIAPDRLVELAGAEWIDVAQAPAEAP